MSPPNKHMYHHNHFKCRLMANVVYVPRDIFLLLKTSQARSPLTSSDISLHLI